MLPSKKIVRLAFFLSTILCFLPSPAKAFTTYTFDFDTTRYWDTSVGQIGHGFDSHTYAPVWDKANENSDFRGLKWSDTLIQGSSMPLVYSWLETATHLHFMPSGFNADCALGNETGKLVANTCVPTNHPAVPIAFTQAHTGAYPQFFEFTFYWGATHYQYSFIPTSLKVYNGADVYLVVFGRKTNGTWTSWPNLNGSVAGTITSDKYSKNWNLIYNNTTEFEFIYIQTMYAKDVVGDADHIATRGPAVGRIIVKT